MYVDHVSKIVHGVPEFIGIYERLNQNGSLRPNDMGAEYAPVLGMGDDLDEALRILRGPSVCRRGVVLLAHDMRYLLLVDVALGEADAAS